MADVPEWVRDIAVAAFDLHDPEAGVLACTYDSLLHRGTTGPAEHRELQFGTTSPRIVLIARLVDGVLLADLRLDPPHSYRLDILQAVRQGRELVRRTVTTDSSGQANAIELAPGITSILVPVQGEVKTPVRTAWMRI